MRLNNVKDLKISSTTNHICGLKLNEKNETRKKRVCARETFYYCKFSFLTESIWRCTCIIISMLSIIILLIKCPTVRNSREKNNPKFWCSHSLCETCLLSIHYVHYHFFIQRAFRLDYLLTNNSRYFIQKGNMCSSVRKHQGKM